jgi:SNF2 family DNA or RNA helicase
MPVYTPRTKPFPHQVEATLAAVKARNYGVFFEPRLGKSKVALDYVGMLALKGEVKRVLVLAPRIAIGVWETELERHAPYSYHAETFTEEWTHFEPDVFFFLAGREETFRRSRDPSGSLMPSPRQKVLEEWSPDAIIIDESHEYKRPGGRGAQDCWRLIRRLRQRRKDGRPYVVLLTGTPSAKGWRDLFAQFRLMDETILGTSASTFDEEYCVYGQGPRKYTVIRYRNLERLREKIHSRSISCSAEQANLAGEISFNVIPYTLPPTIRRQYDELAENFVADFDGALVTAANTGVKRLRLLQITAGFLTTPHRKKIHNAEIATAQAWLSLLFDQGESVVVYGRFTDEVESLGRAASGCGFDAVVIDGRTKSRDRDNAIRAFQSKASTPRALVFQYQAGSRAIELTAAAEVLFGSLPDGWVDFWQCLNRVRGPNQHRPVRISALCGAGTVDRSVLYGLRTKEDIHGLLMKNPKRFLRGGY